MYVCVWLQRLSEFIEFGRYTKNVQCTYAVGEFEEEIRSISFLVTIRVYRCRAEKKRGDLNSIRTLYDKQKLELQVMF